MPNLSLSEFTTTAKRATRGVGYPWGHAEEAGWIISQLEEKKLPGLKALHILLSRLMTAGGSLDHALRQDCVQQSTTQWLCGLSTSIYLLDRKSFILAAKPARLQQVLSPLLLVPALAHITHTSQTYIRAQWHGLTVESIKGKLYITGDNHVPKKPHNVYLDYSHQRQPVLSAKLVVSGMPNPVHDRLLQMMESLAHKTFVPTGECSRQGAGEK